VNAEVTVLNIGTEQAGDHSSLTLYISDDNVLDSSDQFLGGVPIGDIGPGRNVGRAFGVPGLSSVDGRFVFLVVDPHGDAAESDEGNNTQWERVRLP
jgi:hypothetical protein